MVYRLNYFGPDDFEKSFFNHDIPHIPVKGSLVTFSDQHNKISFKVSLIETDYFGLEEIFEIRINVFLER